MISQQTFGSHTHTLFIILTLLSRMSVILLVNRLAKRTFCCAIQNCKLCMRCNFCWIMWCNLIELLLNVIDMRNRFDQVFLHSILFVDSQLMKWKINYINILVKSKIRIEDASGFALKWNMLLNVFDIDCGSRKALSPACLLHIPTRFW